MADGQDKTGAGEATDQTYRIVQLKIQNVKRIKTVGIKPKGPITLLTGRNRQGKTSVLDSISMALGGGKAVCERPIHGDAEKGEILLDFGDLVVERVFRKSGGTEVHVYYRGVEKKRPQEILDDLGGRLSLDPLAFLRMDGDKQVEILKKLTGLDFAELEREHQQAFEDRTAVNRMVKSLGAQAAAMPFYADAPKEEKAASDLVAERTALSNQLREQDELRGMLEDAKRQKERLDARVAATRKEIEALQRRQQDELKAVEAMQEQIVDLVQQVDALPEIDLGPVERQLADIEAVNAKVRANRQHAQKEDEWKAQQEEAERLTRRLQEIEQEKERRLSAAKMPVEGLAFSGTGVTLNGLPLSQASAAEGLEAAVCIAIAMSPKVRVILIRDGSLLDSEAMAKLAALAIDHDVQFWIEMMDESGERGIVLEDGEISHAADPDTVIPTGDQPGSRATPPPTVEQVRGGRWRAVERAF